MGWRLILEICRLLNDGWRVRVSHIYREGNACVDALANLAYNMEVDVLMYEQPPAYLTLLLCSDVIRVTAPQLISL